jgi:hypothetical protein
MLLTNQLILSKKKYQNFSYLTEIQLEEGKLSIHGAKNYQHKVFLKGKNLQSLQGANLKNINYLLLVEENGIVTTNYREKEEYKYVKIILRKPYFILFNIFKKFFPQYKNNFPEQIIFLNKDKKPLMYVFFNEKGIIEKIVKNNEEIIYQYKSIEEKQQ